jgi:hypothetical protein
VWTRSSKSADQLDLFTQDFRRLDGMEDDQVMTGDMAGVLRPK